MSDVGAPPAAPLSGAAAVPAIRVTGAALVYRLYDIGYEIRLEEALDLLASRGPERARPARGEAQAIQIRNPPVTVMLGSEQVMVGGRSRGLMYPAEVSARIFDFGVVSLRLRIPSPKEMSWQAFAGFGTAIDVETDTAAIFERHLHALASGIAPAVERPRMAPVSEDYVVYRIDHLSGAGGERHTAEALRDLDVIPLLLNEPRALSADARKELLPHRFSYYADDLAILTWDNALVVDPAAQNADVEYMLEFANAQLLELRYYDALLDAELPTMYDRMAVARRGSAAMLRFRYAPLLSDLQTMVADFTESVERAENSLKVTDDVYLARIYTAALEIFRFRAWRGGIDRKLAIIRDTYSMLNDEAQAARSHALELAIVLLIVIDIVLALTLR